MTAAGSPGAGSVAAQLWGRGLDALFPVRSAGPTPLAVTPWPPRAGRRGQPLVDLDRVMARVGAVPRLTDLDPRHLMASQPNVIRDGVAYYLGPSYPRTGRTWAERHQLANQFPLIYRRTDGRQIILGGHHRSAAAVLSAQPVRALVVDEASTPADSSGAGAVTPRLLLGDRTDMAAVRAASSEVAVAAIEAGDTVLVDDDDLALSALARLGVDDHEAGWRVERARTGVSRVVDGG